jgi:cyclic lactone autoinducer peptide
MKNKVLLKAAAACAGLFTFLAAMASASACWVWFYQPEEPKALQQE